MREHPIEKQVEGEIARLATRLDQREPSAQVRREMEEFKAQQAASKLSQEYRRAKARADKEAGLRAARVSDEDEFQDAQDRVLGFREREKLRHIFSEISEPHHVDQLVDRYLALTHNMNLVEWDGNPTRAALEAEEEREDLIDALSPEGQRHLEQLELKQSGGTRDEPGRVLDFKPGDSLKAARVSDKDDDEVGNKDPETGRVITQPTDKLGAAQKLATAAAPELKTKLSALVQGIQGARVEGIRDTKDRARALEHSRAPGIAGEGCLDPVPVPDVTVLDRDQPIEQIITRPPLAVFEVLSSEDRLQRLKRKLEDYSQHGHSRGLGHRPTRRHLSPLSGPPTSAERFFFLCGEGHCLPDGSNQRVPGLVSSRLHHCGEAPATQARRTCGITINAALRRA